MSTKVLPKLNIPPHNSSQNQNPQRSCCCALIRLFLRKRCHSQVNPASPDTMSRRSESNVVNVLPPAVLARYLSGPPTAPTGISRAISIPESLPFSATIFLNPSPTAEPQESEEEPQRIVWHEKPLDP